LRSNLPFAISCFLGELEDFVSDAGRLKAKAKNFKGLLVSANRLLLQFSHGNTRKTGIDRIAIAGAEGKTRGGIRYSGWQIDDAGAGSGNRTRIFSLEGCCSTIELYPHAISLPAGGGGWIRTNVGEANGFTVRPL
jgi:hypothetical protein